MPKSGAYGSVRGALSNERPYRDLRSRRRQPRLFSVTIRDRVQQSLRGHLGSARAKRTCQSSEALLAGKLFDDRGNRMSPTWARKESKRWRYYVSQAALQGDKSKAGSIVRVPAAEVEALVTEAVGKLSADRPASQTDIPDRIDRVAIGGTAIQIRLSEVGEGNDSVKTLTVGAAGHHPADHADRQGQCGRHSQEERSALSWAACT